MSPTSEERWLPETPAPTPEPVEPWMPQSLVDEAISGTELNATWLYVAVDEMVDEGLGLVASTWPGVDANGRLRFGDENEDQIVGVFRSHLEELASERRLVLTTEGEVGDKHLDEDLRKRPVRIGDVFAIHRDDFARLRDDAGPEDGPDPDPHPFYDISYEAREQGQMAAAAAVAPPLEEDQAREFLGLEEEEGPDDPEPDADGSDNGGNSPRVGPDRPTGDGEQVFARQKLKASEVEAVADPEQAMERAT